MKYKILDKVTSDIMFEAYGKNPKELFQNAAEALFSIICDIKKIQPEKSKKISLKAENLQELMFSWLQELIAYVDIHEMFFSKFKITKITKTSLEAMIYGEPITPEKGDLVVKSLTNHQYELKKTEKGYKVRVVIDI